MKNRSIWLIFFAASIPALALFGLFILVLRLSHPAPVLVGHLYQQEFKTPLNSNLYPEMLEEKITEEAIRTWISRFGDLDPKMDRTLDHIYRFFMTNVLLHLPDDPIFQYTDYYRLEIENSSDREFKNVLVKFPNVRAVEIHRWGSDPMILSPSDNNYAIGDIGPGESVNIYAWNDRPFYFQEENEIILRHDGGLGEVLLYKMVGPRSSWIKNNLILIALLGVLALVMMWKMVMVIQSCVQNIEPDLEKRVSPD